MTAKPLYFTICSRNYLAYAITLGRSLQSADPAARFLIFLADEAPAPTDQQRIGFETIACADLAIPSFEDMVLRYSIMEFNTAIKPFCFQHIFAVMGEACAVYLDPDIFVVRPLEAVEAALKAGASLVLTPHSEAPLDDGADPDDARLLRTGVYNLGFAAFADTDETRRFLGWWGERLRADCRVALSEGIFVDQKWMDLAPAYLRATHILHNPGYNAAYWNLAHRPVRRAGDAWMAGDAPLVFFHFSGVVPGNAGVFSKHQDRFGVGDIGELRDLLSQYIHALDANGHTYWKGVAYGYGYDGEGKAISDIARAVYRNAFPQPADQPMTPGEALDALCNAPAPGMAQSPGPITRFTHALWLMRDDLHSHFDLATPSGRINYNGWLLRSGVEEHRLEPRYLAHLGVVDQPAEAAAVATPARTGRLGAPLRLLLKYRHHLRPLAAIVPIGLLTRFKHALNRQLDRAAPSELSAFGLQAGSQAAEEVAVPATLADALELAPDGTGVTAVYGYFATESGVGEAGRRTYRALRAVGRPVSARLIGTRGHFAESIAFDLPLDSANTPADVHLFHMNADELCHANLRLGDQPFSPERLRVGYWAWELDRFPDAWAPAFDRVDEIWVPSAFTRACVQSATDKPVHVIPHPVPVPDPVSKAQQASARLRFGLPHDKIAFLTLFDFNSFIERKNPYAALAAFAEARAQADNLALVIKCHGHTRFDAVRQQLMKYIRALPDVYVIDRVLSGEEMDALYAACDGLVSLHRSEGFGLTIAEAMARAMPVIATGYSGNADFLDDSVGVPVPYTLIPVAPDAYPFWEGCVWAEPDTGFAARAMVELAGDEGLRARLGAAARTRIAERLSLEAVGRQMDTLLEARLAARADAA